MKMYELKALIDEHCADGFEEDRVFILINVGGSEVILNPDELISPLTWAHVSYLTVQESIRDD